MHKPSSNEIKRWPMESYVFSSYRSLTVGKVDLNAHSECPLQLLLFCHWFHVDVNHIHCNSIDLTTESVRERDKWRETEINQPFELFSAAPLSSLVCALCRARCSSKETRRACRHDSLMMIGMETRIKTSSPFIALYLQLDFHYWRLPPLEERSC